MRKGNLFSKNMSEFVEDILLVIVRVLLGQKRRIKIVRDSKSSYLVSWRESVI